MVSLIHLILCANFKLFIKQLVVCFQPYIQSITKSCKLPPLTPKYPESAYVYPCSLPPPTTLRSMLPHLPQTTARAARVMAYNISLSCYSPAHTLTMASQCTVVTPNPNFRSSVWFGSFLSLFGEVYFGFMDVSDSQPKAIF